MLLARLRPYLARAPSRTMDVLACNLGGCGHITRTKPLPGIECWPAEQRNISRYVFCHPAARDLFAERDQVLGGCVARLRALAGIEPDAADLTQLVNELLTTSPELTRLWELYEVRPPAPTAKKINHPEAGTLALSFQSMQIEDTPRHRLVTYYADPGTRDHTAMVHLDRVNDEQSGEPVQPQLS
ncbi:MmyB family transcriptional regulator [Amycolatopsis japonica]|uniref:MmyB family transcriptional regulator n=1 Tax=Amycolatopsis japonica TaxID=208439 RepID=UPI001E450857|nr:MULTISPECIES: hypothetical protein [Amycolatopsis]